MLYVVCAYILAGLIYIAMSPTHEPPTRCVKCNKKICPSEKIDREKEQEFFNEVFNQKDEE